MTTWPSEARLHARYWAASAHTCHGDCGAFPCSPGPLLGKGKVLWLGMDRGDPGTEPLQEVALS